MEDFAGFGVARGIEGCRLVGGEMEKHAARNRGIEPQGLEGGDQGVAAKHSAEPRDSSVGERSLGRVRDQRVEVRDRAAKGFVEDVIGGDHRSGPGGRSAERSPRLAKRAKGGAVQRFTGARAIAADLEQDSLLALGVEIKHKGRQIRIQPVGRRFETQGRGAAPIIKPAICERNAVGADVRRLHRPASKAPRAAHLEEVGEIRSESDIYPDLSRLLVEIAHRQPFVTCAVPQEAGAAQMQEVMLQNQRSLRRADRDL